MTSQTPSLDRSPATSQSAPRPRPRQARGVATRHKLVEAATIAFAKHGLQATNLAEHILKPAGVSTGSFYHQFADKTELLIEVISDGIGARHDLVFGGISNDQHPTIQAVIVSGFESLFLSLDTDEHAWQIQLAEQHSADHRVRQVVLAGRERWIVAVSNVLEHLGNTNSQTTRNAAVALVSFATGTANVYLSLDPLSRKAQREDLLIGAITFSAAGTTAMLNQKTASPDATE